MRSFLVLFAVFVVALAKEKKLVKLDPEITVRLGKHVIDCINENKLDTDFVHQVKSGDATPSDKFVLCVMDKAMIVDESGHWKTDRVTAFFPENLRSELKGVFEECRKKEGKTRQETAFNNYICFDEKTGIFPDL